VACFRCQQLTEGCSQRLEAPHSLAVDARLGQLLDQLATHVVASRAEPLEQHSRAGEHVHDVPACPVHHERRVDQINGERLPSYRHVFYRRIMLHELTANLLAIH
jgi:hypothetical protein